MAATLPKDKYKCDFSSKIINDEPVIPVQLKESCSQTDENSCNADSACSWCKSAAVKAKCNTLANAKALPAAVFSCSKVNFFDDFNNEE